MEGCTFPSNFALQPTESVSFWMLVVFAMQYFSPVHLDLENDLIQSLYFFPKIQKKLQVLADPVVVNFFEMYLIQHLEIQKNTIFLDEFFF